MKKLLLSLSCALVSMFASAQHENDLRLPLTGGSAAGDEMAINVSETNDKGEPLSATYTITNGTWGDNASHLSLFKHNLSAETLNGYKSVVVEFAEPVPASAGDATYNFIPVGLVCPINWTKIAGTDKLEITFNDTQKNNGIEDFSVFFNASGDLKDVTITINGIWLIKEEEIAKPDGQSLTADMFHQWDGYGENANVVGNPNGACAWGESTGLPYGDGNVNGSYYADLSEYAILALTVTDGTPRLLLNRQGMNNSGDYIEINNANNQYVKVIGNVWYINLAQITSTAGYAHLNCIKGANWANVTITEAILQVKDTNKIFPEVFKLPEGETDIQTLPWLGGSNSNSNNLTSDTDATIYGTDAGPNNKNEISYFDLSEYGHIQLYGQEGDVVRLFINRVESNDYIFFVVIGEDGIGRLDFNEVYAKQGINYIHLNGIKAAQTWAYTGARGKALVNHISVGGSAIVSPLTEIVKTINTTNITSFSSIYNVEVPSGVSVYKAQANEDCIQLTKVETNIIPKHTGVILYSDNSIETLTITEATSNADFSGNALIPTSVAMKSIAPDYTYALMASEIAFAPVAKDTKISSNKAYLTIEGASEVRLRVVFNDATGINAIADKADNAYYNLQGMKINNPAKGVYINNGKKMIVK